MGVIRIRGLGGDPFTVLAEEQRLPSKHGRAIARGRAGMSLVLILKICPAEQRAESRISLRWKPGSASGSERTIAFRACVHYVFPA